MGLVIKTAEQIKNDLLGAISNDYEKSEGNVTYDIPASVAIELETLYQNVKLCFDSINVDNLTGSELTRFVKQRKGVYRKEATHAIGNLTVTGQGTISKGDLFETATGLQFEATETKAITTTGTISIKCVTAGSVGNVGANSIIFIPVTITGIIAVTNSNPTYDGFDDETDESLRQRYYEALRIPATSGNKYHYLKWAKEVQGVGNAKVFPLWNGANSVKICIINSDMLPASTEIVNATQQYIDPNSTGRGEGQAPIGAYCTVTSATPLNLILSVDVVEREGYTLEIVKENIKQSVTAYLKEIAFNQDYVSFAKVGSIIFNTEGVRDYTTLTINGKTTNIDIPTESVAVLENVIVT